MTTETIYFDNASKTLHGMMPPEATESHIERDVVRHPLVQKVIEAYPEKRSS